MARYRAELPENGLRVIMEDPVALGRQKLLVSSFDCSARVSD